jgi:MoxR-like ATPase
MSDKTATVITVPVGRPLVSALNAVFAANLVPLVAGPTGVGKTETFEEVARASGWKYLARDLSLLEPPDLVGLPAPDGKVTKYLPPAFLPTEKNGKGLLVLDEVNRAPAYMRAPCLQFVLNRSLNDYRLPDGWRLAVAINPAEDGYDVDELDPALEARFVRINVVASPDEWLVWARQNDIDPRVIDYVASDLAVFDGQASNPRAWTFVSRLMRAADELNTPPSILQAVVGGCVGQERAAAFLRYSQDQVKPFSAEEVLSAYKRVRPTVRAWVADGKLDLVEGTLLNVQKRLQSRTGYSEVRSDEEAWKNVGRLLGDLPGDLLATGKAFFEDHDYDQPTILRAKK